MSGRSPYVKRQQFGRTSYYDIDTLIRRSLVYEALSSVIITLYAGSATLLNWLVRVSIGQQNNSLAIVASTLGLVAMFQPLRWRIQRAVDRRFYRRKYDAARTLAAFDASLRQEVELSQLSASLLDMVEETMRPTQVTLWLREPPSEDTANNRGAPRK